MKNMRIQLYATLACFLLTLVTTYGQAENLMWKQDEWLYGERFIVYNPYCIWSGSGKDKSACRIVAGGRITRRD